MSQPSRSRQNSSYVCNNGLHKICEKKLRLSLVNEEENTTHQLASSQLRNYSEVLNAEQRDSISRWYKLFVWDVRNLFCQKGSAVKKAECRLPHKKVSSIYHYRYVKTEKCVTEYKRKRRFQPKLPKVRSKFWWVSKKRTTDLSGSKFPFIKKSTKSLIFRNGTRVSMTGHGIMGWNDEYTRRISMMY